MRAVQLGQLGQPQLDMLEQYCQHWGLAVNLMKTKLILSWAHAAGSAGGCRSGRAALWWPALGSGGQL